jgi:hypothetical protein
LELRQDLHVQCRNDLFRQSPGEVDVAQDAENTLVSPSKSLKLIAPPYPG